MPRDFDFDFDLEVLEDFDFESEGSRQPGNFAFVQREFVDEDFSDALTVIEYNELCKKEFARPLGFILTPLVGTARGVAWGVRIQFNASRRQLQRKWVYKRSRILQGNRFRWT